MLLLHGSLGMADGLLALVAWFLDLRDGRWVALVAWFLRDGRWVALVAWFLRDGRWVALVAWFLRDTRVIKSCLRIDNHHSP